MNDSSYCRCYAHRARTSFTVLVLDNNDALEPVDCAKEKKFSELLSKLKYTAGVSMGHIT